MRNRIAKLLLTGLGAILWYLVAPLLSTEAHAILDSMSIANQPAQHTKLLTGPKSAFQINPLPFSSSAERRA
jgi:hypothetical protein